MDFSDLKKQMEKLKETAKVQQEKENKPSNVDERFFKPKKDSAGNISCVIRFLPQLDFSKPAYAEKRGHYIKINDKMLGFNCPEDIEKDSCPSCAKAKPFWSEYWAARNAHGKDHPSCKAALKNANIWTHNTQTVTNILVVQNPADPETEGKVFLYNMPKVVLEKYKQKLFPKDEMDEMVIIYHPIEGRNFKLDAYTKKPTSDTEFTDYDKSYFYDRQTSISSDEQVIMKVLNETYDIEKYLNETKPNIEEVKKKFSDFQKFLGVSNIKEKKEESKPQVNEEVVDDSLDEVEEVSMDDIDSLFGD